MGAEDGPNNKIKITSVTCNVISGRFIFIVDGSAD